jgi:glycosyltransferase involved in cell wall biosynthesis
VRYPAPIDPVSRLSPPTLAGADVYHSPVFALPEQACSRDGPRRFLTVYDVIPLLHPELFSWGGEQWLRAIVDSVRPDDCVLTISQRTKDDLLTLRPAMDPDRVFVTHLAADPARFYPCDDPARLAAVRGRYGIPEGPYVLSVGTLEPRKNLPHLLRTFADLVRAERADDLRLVLTGAKGWDFETIFSEVEQLAALRDRVVFTGYVDDGDLAPLYSGAAVFVYPSLYEGFGLPPLEAMQCGTPVITSNTSSLPEVVGDAGLMVDPRDGDALAQAMLDVYRAPGRRADLAARALVRAAQFSWDRYARETVAAYRAAT